MRFRSTLFAFAPIGFLVGVAADAAPPDYTIEKIALEADAAPGGGSIAMIFGESAIDDGGRIVMSANVGGGLQLQILWDGATLNSALAEGDPIVTPPGGVVVTPRRGKVGAPDLYAFAASYDQPPLGDGVFLRDGLAEAAILLSGDSAPGGGTVTSLRYVSDINENGIVAFGGRVDPGDGSSVPAHFVGTPDSVSEVFREGGTTPIGGVWSGVEPFHVTSVQPDGSVGFGAEVSGGSASHGIFRWHAGVVSPVVLTGSVPDGSGDQFTYIANWVASNEAGDLSFGVDVVRSGTVTPIEAIYTVSAGQVEGVVYGLDVIAGTNSELRFSGQLGSPPADISADGVVAYTALILDPLDDSNGAILVSQGGTTKIVAKGGDPVPGLPGATFTGDFTNVRINSSGQIAITGNTDQGSGVFLATPVVPGVPALPGARFVLIILLIATSGLMSGWPRREQ